MFIFLGKNEEIVVWKRFFWKKEFVLVFFLIINRFIFFDISTLKYRGMFI